MTLDEMIKALFDEPEYREFLRLQNLIKLNKARAGKLQVSGGGGSRPTHSLSGTGNFAAAGTRCWLALWGV